MTDDTTKKAVFEFLKHFEEVFDKDWNYTCFMLGLASTDEQKKLNHEKTKEVMKKFFGKIGETSNEIDFGSFLKPSVPIEIACQDWGIASFF